MSSLERLGRITHPVYGKCVQVAFVVDRRRVVSVYPIDQTLARHPRHPTGYGPNIHSVSPSCSFYSDLCKYAQFRWGGGVMSSAFRVFVLGDRREIYVRPEAVQVIYDQEATLDSKPTSVVCTGTTNLVVPYTAAQVLEILK